MAAKYSREWKANRNAKLTSAKKMMQGFRDILNANPNRKGGKLPRVK
jgi:hypothetical protein